MKRSIALFLSAILVLPPLGAPSMAFAAPRGHAFCKGGLPGKEELAKRLTESLAKDASGMTPLRGCVASPVQFLEAFRKGDQQRHDLTLATLVRFVHEDLEKTEIDHSIKWTSSCVKDGGHGPDAVIMHCVVETVKPGTLVYKDKVTNTIVIKFDCVNPGLAPAEPIPCAFVRVAVPRPTKLTQLVFGDYTAEELTACPLFYAGPFPEGGRPRKGDFQPLEGPLVCDTRSVERRVNLPLAHKGCVPVKAGWYFEQVPARVATDSNLRVVNCLPWTDALGAEPDDYRKSDGIPVATIWPNAASVPEAYAGTDLYWQR
jgi:hypothetical protein